MICRLCKGLQNLFCMQEGKCEWYTCPGCQGNGVRGPIGLSVIPLSKNQTRFCRVVDDEGGVVDKRKGLQKAK